MECGDLSSLSTAEFIPPPAFDGFHGGMAAFLTWRHF
jgi:hypothetical protein